MGRKERTIFITILANVVLIVLRFFLAGLSGSIGLKANAWHSFTDVFVSGVVFIGLMITRHAGERLKIATKKFWQFLCLCLFFTWVLKFCPMRSAVRVLNCDMYHL